MPPRKLVRSDGRVEYRSDGRLHREDGPAMILPDGHEKWYRHGRLERERFADGEWRHYRNGRLHRSDGPAIDGPRQLCWFDDGRESRLDGPAQFLKATGVEVWWHDGRMHREDGPALTHPDGRSLWYLDGRLHRIGGPAATGPDGAQDWYVDGFLHREDGPAMVRPNGHRVWLWRGRVHRSGGPAIEMPGGRTFFTKAGFVLGADGRPLDAAALLALLPDPVSIFTSVTIRSVEGRAFKLPPRAPFVAAQNAVVARTPVQDSAGEIPAVRRGAGRR